MSETENKFPLWAILIIYEKSNNLAMYCSAFEQFELLVNWLGPLEDGDKLTNHPSHKLTKLENSYQLQEISAILNLEPGKLFHFHNKVIKDMTYHGSKTETT